MASDLKRYVVSTKVEVEQVASDLKRYVVSTKVEVEQVTSDLKGRRWAAPDASAGCAQSPGRPYRIFPQSAQ